MMLTIPAAVGFQVFTIFDLQGALHQIDRTAYVVPAHQPSG